MGKLKTHRGAAKRFKITGTGNVKRPKAYKGHLTAKKSATRKRNLRKSTVAYKADQKKVKRALGK